MQFGQGRGIETSFFSCIQDVLRNQTAVTDLVPGSRRWWRLELGLDTCEIEIL
jgi:hypothetical protein